MDFPILTQNLYNSCENLNGVFYAKEAIYDPQTEFDFIYEGSYVFLINSKLNRSEGPSMICDNGRNTEIWYCKDNVVHRENGPAHLFYCNENVVINLNHMSFEPIGPAMCIEHLINNRPHNLLGPAIIWDQDQYKSTQYWINGKELTQESFEINELVVREKNKISLLQKINGLK